MPIQAAANKLRRELESGAADAVRARLEREAAGGAVEETDVDATDAETTVAAASAAAPTAAASVPTAAAAVDGAASGAGEKVLGKFSGKKTKAASKSGGAAMTTYEILFKSGIPATDVPAFVEPLHWLRFFPPLGEADLRSFGLLTDWRRSFITTDANPFYDAFIRWQFNTLRARDKLGAAFLSVSTHRYDALLFYTHCTRPPPCTHTRTYMQDSASGRLFIRLSTAKRALTMTVPQARVYSRRSTRLSNSACVMCPQRTLTRLHSHR